MRTTKRQQAAVLIETLPDGGSVWVTPEPEDLTIEQEARNVDDGKGWGAQFARSVRDTVKKHGIWGWCSIRLTYVRDGKAADAHLGACCYESAHDFKKGGYYEQMLEEAQREWADGNTEPVRAEIKLVYL